MMNVVTTIFIASLVFASFCNFPAFSSGSDSVISSTIKDEPVENPAPAGLDSYTPTSLAEIDEVDTLYNSDSGQTHNFERMWVSDLNCAELIEEKCRPLLGWMIRQTYCFCDVSYNAYPTEYLCIESTVATDDPLEVSVGVDPNALTQLTDTVSTTPGINYIPIGPYLTGTIFYVCLSEISENAVVPSGPFFIDSMYLCLDLENPIEPIDAIERDGYGSTTNFPGMQAIGGDYATLAEERVRIYRNIYAWDISQTYRFDTLNYNSFPNETLEIRLVNTLTYAVMIYVGTTPNSYNYIGSIQTARTYQFDVHARLTGPAFYVSFMRDDEYSSGSCYVDYVGLIYSGLPQILWTSPLTGSKFSSPGLIEFTYTTETPVTTMELSVAGAVVTFTSQRLADPRPGVAAWKGTFAATMVGQYDGFTPFVLRMTTIGGLTDSAGRTFEAVSWEFMDTDGDGLSNYEEGAIYNSDPYNGASPAWNIGHFNFDIIGGNPAGWDTSEYGTDYISVINPPNSLIGGDGSRLVNIHDENNGIFGYASITYNVLLGYGSQFADVTFDVAFGQDAWIFYMDFNNKHDNDLYSDSVASCSIYNLVPYQMAHVEVFFDFTDHLYSILINGQNKDPSQPQRSFRTNVDCINRIHIYTTESESWTNPPFDAYVDNIHATNLEADNMIVKEHAVIPIIVSKIYYPDMWGPGSYQTISCSESSSVSFNYEIGLEGGDNEISYSVTSTTLEIERFTWTVTEQTGTCWGGFLWKGKVRLAGFKYPGASRIRYNANFAFDADPLYEGGAFLVNETEFFTAFGDVYPDSMPLPDPAATARPDEITSMDFVWGSPIPYSRTLTSTSTQAIALDLSLPLYTGINLKVGASINWENTISYDVDFLIDVNHLTHIVAHNTVDRRNRAFWFEEV